MKNKNVYLLSLVLLVAFVFNPYGTNFFELPKIHFLSIFLAITTIILVISFLKNRQLNFRYNKIVTILFLLWLASLVVSTIFSIAPELSFWGSYSRFQGLYSHLIYLSFFLLFLNVLRDKKSQEIFLKALLLIGSLVALHSVLQQFGILTFSKAAMQEFLGRSFATFGHPNFLGQFLILPIWVGAYFAISRKGRARILYSLPTILTIAGLLVTENRASILGVIVGVICLILFSLRLKTIYKVALSLVAVLAFGAFIFLVAPSLRSLTTRMHLWGDTIQLINENPLFGSGLETFRLVFQKVTSAEFFGLEKIYSIADRAHNEYLDMLIMQGRVGFIVFATIIFGILAKVIKQKSKLVLTMAAALISILVSNFFSFSLVVHYLLFMALLAILLNQILKFKDLQIKQTFLTVLIAGGLFALSILLVFNSVKTIHADNQFKAGMNSIYAGEVDKGLSGIINAANLNIHQGDIFFHLSDILFLLGKQLENSTILEKASDIVDFAGDFTNNDFRYYFAKARISAYLGEYDQAQQYYLESSNLAPINPIVMKEWGVMYYLKGDYDLAIEKLELFLSLIPDHWKHKVDLEEVDSEVKEEYR